MSDNEALLQIAAELDELISIYIGAYDHIEGDATFTFYPFGTSDQRATNANALKTVVTNQGPADIQVTENGLLVALVNAGESWESPLSGAGNIIATPIDNGNGLLGSNIAIATYCKAS